ncbi:hypothetical protein HPB50_020320 [Hyalomma asiaticum]|uniref:Uncharacterized protein n=1 Tax=Hyalomma asiaticum TaxID=266040 RepID=A0ACB7RKI8_HYAAI|nr:hypothetical protein HPB50_020320 [Hyalomma asiaticum]
MNISQPVVSRAVASISSLIARTLFPVLVKFPEASEMSSVMQDFYRIAKFPGVSGCIDCTHVPIKSPGGVYAEAITGPDLRFYDLVASWPGSAHDSRIFDSSRARVLYETGVVAGTLLGDMGYACRSYLMTPLKDPPRAILF